MKNDLLTVVMVVLGDAGDPNCKGVIGMLTIIRKEPCAAPRFSP